MAPNALTSQRRPMAAALLAAAEEQIKIGKLELSRKDAIAHQVWHAAVEGEILFPDGRIIYIDDSADWLNLVKWIMQHIEGPAVSIADSRAMNAVVRVVYGDEQLYDADQEQVVESASQEL